MLRNQKLEKFEFRTFIFGWKYRNWQKYWERIGNLFFRGSWNGWAYLSGDRPKWALVRARLGWNTDGVKAGGWSEEERRSFCPLVSHPTSFSLARCPVKSVTLWLPPVNEGTAPPSHLFSHTLAFRLQTRDPKTRCNRAQGAVGCFIPNCLSTDFSPLALSPDLLNLPSWRLIGGRLSS